MSRSAEEIAASNEKRRVTMQKKREKLEELEGEIEMLQNHNEYLQDEVDRLELENETLKSNLMMLQVPLPSSDDEESNVEPAANQDEGHVDTSTIPEEDDQTDDE